MSTNQAFAVHLKAALYLDLTCQLQQRRDPRSLDDIAAVALREWMARNYAQTVERGYQWKELFLPNGTRLRIRNAGLCHYAQIEGDLLIHEGKITTPNAWVAHIAGGVRNAWRDIFIRRNHTEAWTRASAWRVREAANPRRPGTNRRLQARRRLD
jgi:hypothetical protein